MLLEGEPLLKTEFAVKERVTWLLKQGMIKSYLLATKHGSEKNLKDGLIIWQKPNLDKKAQHTVQLTFKCPELGNPPLFP